MKFKEFCQKHGIEHRCSSPFQYQSNGLAERYIRTVRDMLVTTNGEKVKQMWWEIIPKIEFSLNATVQSTTEFSPFEIVFKRKKMHAAGGVSLTENGEDVKKMVKENAEREANHMEQ